MPHIARQPRRCGRAAAGTDSTKNLSQRATEASSPAVSLPHTRAYPSRGYIPSASTKYTPTREGSSRSRRCPVPVCSGTSSTSSNGRSRVTSPRWARGDHPRGDSDGAGDDGRGRLRRNGTSGTGKTVTDRADPPKVPSVSRSATPHNPLDQTAPRLTSRHWSRASAMRSTLEAGGTAP